MRAEFVGAPRCPHAISPAQGIATDDAIAERGEARETWQGAVCSGCAAHLADSGPECGKVDTGRVGTEDMVATAVAAGNVPAGAIGNAGTVAAGIGGVQAPSTAKRRRATPALGVPTLEPQAVLRPREFSRLAHR